MTEVSSWKSTIHLISSGLETPAILILILFVIIVVLELGSLAVEGILERRKAKVDTEYLLTAIQGKSRAEIRVILAKSNFSKTKKQTFYQLLDSETLSVNVAQVLAAGLIAAEETRAWKVIAVTDVIARIGPMFGLMATLIPLGPGLIALGQGDTKTLADSLLTAFDATVAGLAASGVAFVISRIRKRWYEDDLISTETVMEGILEELYENAESKKPAPEKQAI